MNERPAVAAVDLGATSGRVVVGHVSPDELSIRTVARFDNNPVRTIDGLHWNILELYRGVLGGLQEAVRAEPGLRSIAVDSWAVDYALLRRRGMLGTPYHYRDGRTAAGVDAVHALISPAELYARNGLQFLPFNTVYQLAAERLAGSFECAESMVMIPDLIGFWLTGRQVTERTNASTTGLLDPTTGQWDDELIARLGMPRALFGQLIGAGSLVGPLLPEVAADLGTSASTGPAVVAVGSHDTASAVVAVPLSGPGAAYISSGTWSLVGLELEAPVLSEESRAANVTNEGGVDGRVRYLRNVMGLWLLSECIRAWSKGPDRPELQDLLAGAASLAPGSVGTFDVDDPAFLAPGDMPVRISQHFLRKGQSPPGSRVAMVRSVLESLAEAYARALADASRLSGTEITTVHIVGGGSLNALLCQLTADRVGLPVWAGPVEATAIGNVLIQARSQGLVRGGLEDLRALVARTYPPIEYLPRPRTTTKG